MNSDSEEESFEAFAEIYPPRINDKGEYDIREWGYKLFMCQVLIQDEHPEGPVMRVQLRDLYNRRLIAQVSFDGTRDVQSIPDSIRHFVVTVRNGPLAADLGLAFIDASDAMEFSLIVESFAADALIEQGREMRRASCAARRRPSAPFETKTHTRCLSDDHTPARGAAEHLRSPHPEELTESDGEEFGEFQ